MALADVLALIDAKIATIDNERAGLVAARAELLRFQDGGRKPGRPSSLVARGQSSTDTLLLDALAHGPLSSSALAKAVKLDQHATIRRLRVLVVSGEIRRQGAGRSTTYALGG